MKFEILCTGDELLTGLTLDTNSHFLSGLLLDRLGQRVDRIQVVGDIREHIVEALKQVAERAEAAVVCGGLGPTEDDLTVECAAEAAGVSWVEDPTLVEALKKGFAKRGIALTPNNFRQARVPEGAIVIRNPVGVAPMLIRHIGKCEFYFLPGVPREFRHLAEFEVLPRLAQRLEAAGKRVFRAFRLLKTIGLPESHLDDKVKPLALRHPKVVFGFRTHAPENHLKLLAEADSQMAADQALQDATEDARLLLRPWLFGEDAETLTGNLGKWLQAKKLTVSVAESCTGGLVSAMLSEPPGASEWFVGGAVTYLETMKKKWANVSEESLREKGAVSEEVAKEMARGIRAETQASVGLSVTGFAGPTGGTEQAPVGTVYCALSCEAGEVCEKIRLSGDRARVRQFAAAALLDLLRKHISSCRFHLT